MLRIRSGSKDQLMTHKAHRTALALLLAACAWLASNRAQAWAGGGHLGLNLDEGNIHLGGDLLFPIVDVSSNLKLSVWPSVAYVFVHRGHDVVLFGADLPFEFRLPNTIVAPFVGPGLGLSVAREANLKLNVVGGLFINPANGVRLFTELALRFVRGTYVDLLLGVLFEV
jgi:hypothetical protein